MLGPDVCYLVCGVRAVRLPPCQCLSRSTSAMPRMQLTIPSPPLFCGCLAESPSPRPPRTLLCCLSCPLATSGKACSCRSTVTARTANSSLQFAVVPLECLQPRSHTLSSPAVLSSSCWVWSSSSFGDSARMPGAKGKFRGRGATPLPSQPRSLSKPPLLLLYCPRRSSRPPDYLPRIHPSARSLQLLYIFSPVAPDHQTHSKLIYNERGDLYPHWPGRLPGW